MAPRGAGDVRVINVDRLMWASDYPHSDSTWPESRQTLEKQLAGVSEEEQRKIVAENASTLYGIAFR